MRFHAHLTALAIALGAGAAIAAASPTASAEAPTQSASTEAPTPSASADTKTPSGKPNRHSVVKASAAVRSSSNAATRTRRPGITRPPRAVVQPVVPAAQPGVTVTRSGQSPFVLSGQTPAAAELSGITYAGGTDYYAIGDNGATSIWSLYTSIDSRNGRIRSSLVTGGISAPGLGADSEGIALSPTGNTVWISDEISSTITEFSLSTGLKVGAVTVPDIYRPANVQNNMGLESLSYGAGKLWTANEEALKSDGPLSTTSAGSWVRIQQFAGPDLTPAGQYAYRTDPISRISGLISVQRSGLVDLLALPNGEVLALERELGGCLPHFRSRIYLIDFTGATDVATLPSLTADGFTPVNKTLLWQANTALDNFEGITLGPRRDDGSYTLLLISDNGAGAMGQRQSVFSLTLAGMTGAETPPAPIVV